MSNSTAWIVRSHVFVSVKVCLNVCLSSTAEVVEELQGLRGTLVDDGPGSPGLQKAQTYEHITSASEVTYSAREMDKEKQFSAQCSFTLLYDRSGYALL